MMTNIEDSDGSQRSLQECRDSGISLESVPQASGQTVQLISTMFPILGKEVRSLSDSDSEQDSEDNCANKDIKLKTAAMREESDKVKFTNIMCNETFIVFKVVCVPRDTNIEKIEMDQNDLVLLKNELERLICLYSLQIKNIEDKGQLVTVYIRLQGMCEDTQNIIAEGKIEHHKFNFLLTDRFEVTGRNPTLLSIWAQGVKNACLQNNFGYKYVEDNNGNLLHCFDIQKPDRVFCKPFSDFSGSHTINIKVVTTTKGIMLEVGIGHLFFQNFHLLEQYSMYKLAEKKTDDNLMRRREMIKGLLQGRLVYDTQDERISHIYKIDFDKPHPNHSMQPSIYVYPSNSELGNGNNRPILCSAQQLHLAGITFNQQQSDPNVSLFMNPSSMKIQELVTLFTLGLSDSARRQNLKNAGVNIEIYPSPLQLEGHLVEPPDAIFNLGEYCADGVLNYDGKNQYLLNSPFLLPENYKFLFVCSDQFDINHIIEDLSIKINVRICGKGMGCDTKYDCVGPDLVEYKSSMYDAWSKCIDKVFNETPDSVMPLFMIRLREAHIRDLIIQKAIKAARQFQVISVDTYKNPRICYPDKILTQLSAKLGGVPWTIQMDSCYKRTMFIGIDLKYQPGKAPNMYSMVATLNNYNVHCVNQTMPIEKLMVNEEEDEDKINYSRVPQQQDIQERQFKQKLEYLLAKRMEANQNKLGDYDSIVVFRRVDKNHKLAYDINTNLDDAIMEFNLYQNEIAIIESVFRAEFTKLNKPCTFCIVLVEDHQTVGYLSPCNTNDISNEYDSGCFIDDDVQYASYVYDPITLRDVVGENGNNIADSYIIVPPQFQNVNAKSVRYTQIRAFDEGNIGLKDRSAFIQCVYSSSFSYYGGESRLQVPGVVQNACKLNEACCKRLNNFEINIGSEEHSTNTLWYL